jgi:hypothetical protein
MRIELFRPDDSEHVLASVRYVDGALEVGADDARTRDAVDRIFRRSPVVVDEPSLRPAGARGPVVEPPGSIQWFLAAGRVRGGAEGLAIRVVPEEEAAMGWDPAGAYRTFAEALARRVRAGVAARTPEREGEQTRPS